MKKYNIICVRLDYNVQIIDTFLSHKDAIEYLSSLIDREYKNEDKIKYFKVYYESRDAITVSHIGYLYKSFYAKYFILDFEDNTDTRYDSD